MSAQRPTERFKNALQNITTDRTPHNVLASLYGLDSHVPLILVFGPAGHPVLQVPLQRAQSLHVEARQADTARAEPHVGLQSVSHCLPGEKRFCVQDDYVGLNIRKSINTVCCLTDSIENGERDISPKAYTLINYISKGMFLLQAQISHPFS